MYSKMPVIYFFFYLKDHVHQWRQYRLHWTHLTLGAIIDVVPHEAEAQMEICVQEVQWKVWGEQELWAVGEELCCDAVTTRQPVPWGAPMFF